MSESLPDMADPAILGPDAAAEVWLVRREAGADLDRDPAFGSWLAASPENAKAWTRVLAFWAHVADEPADPLVEAMRRDALSARPASRRAVWPAAAGIAAALAVGLLVRTALAPRLSDEPGRAWIPETAAVAFSNGGFAPKTVTLADGSQVTLSAGAAIAVADASAHRGARLLRGRAFFSVIHDSARPFRVEVGDRWISDLGTQFDVQFSEQDLTVIVVQGSVSVASPLEPKGVVALAGQTIDVKPTGAVSAPQPADLPKDLAWRSGMIEFHDTPLVEAVREVNQAGGPQVTVKGAGDLRVSGRFQAGDPKAFARALAQVYPLRAVDRPDGGVDLIRRRSK